MPRRLLESLVWGYVGAVLVFLYLPLIPPLLFSLQAGPPGAPPAVRAYVELWRNPVLTGAIRTSLVIGALTAILTPPLAVLAAMGVRELRAPRAVLLLLLMPLFIPGVSMGLAGAFLFRFLSVAPSLWTILIMHVLWTLPFAFLIVLTAMAGFDPAFLEAAYVHGAGRMRAFVDVELPLTAPGIAGAAMSAFILSLNETVRTGLVQGPLNTVQTYIWSTYLQVGLSPTVYALMSLLIVLTMILVLIAPLLGRRPMRTASL